MYNNDIRIDVYSEIKGKSVQFAIKRLMDIILSLIGIIILSPIFFDTYYMDKA